MDVNADCEDYDDDFEEYEIIDDSDQCQNGEADEDNPDENVKADCLDFQDTPDPAIPTGSAKIEDNHLDYNSKMKEIVERTGYKHKTSSGQHKYGGPPPNYTGPSPGPGHEIFVGKIPSNILEDELIPMFEECGTIYELRLMMKPQSMESKGFAFVTYVEKESAKMAYDRYNDYEIRPNQQIKVNISIPNTRLYIGNIKKSKSREEIFQEMSKYVEGLREVIVYGQPDAPELKNRGFAFLDFDSHKHASEARKRLSYDSFQCHLFNLNCVIEWAEPLEEHSEEEMSKVKVLYVCNLKSNITREDMEIAFQPFGKLEKVKRIKDFCFVHFMKREDAIKALQELDSKVIKDSVLNVTLARPIDTKVKEKKFLLPLPKTIPGSPMVGAALVPMPLMRSGQMTSRGGRGGHHYQYYENYEGYDEEYNYDESGYDYYWGYSQPRSSPLPGRGRRAMMGRPLLSRPPLMRTPSLQPLMGGIASKQNMRFQAPMTPHSERGGVTGHGIATKRKASDYIFGIDNPSKQTKSDNHPSMQNTIAQNQTAKRDNWESLPIAQKPLSQLMLDFGEQWF